MSPTSARPVARLAAALAALVLVAAACGGSDGEGADGDGADSAAGPQYGGEVRYALEAETSGGWCAPESVLAQSGMVVARAIYDFLTVPKAGGGFAPYLAESVEPDEDATEWTITLREGVTFHDGTALDSTVLKNNIDAWLGRYPNRTTLLLDIVFDNVDTVEIVDDLTVRLTTTVPWPALPAYLNGGGRLGIMAQAQLDDTATCDAELIGTGPFVLEEWSENERLVANRNPDYWATDAEGNQLPYLDRIVFRPVQDPDAAVNGLLSDGIDLMTTSSPEAIGALEGAAENGEVDVVRAEGGAESEMFMFNESRPPFDDRTAREAVARATDLDTYSEVLRGEPSDGANGPFPPGEPGHLEDTGYPEFDLERARELVADYEQRTDGPLRFTLHTCVTAGCARGAQLAQQMWEDAGMDVELASLEQSGLIELGIGGDWQAMAYRNFPSGVPDGNYVWWYTGSPINFGRIADPEVDALLDAGRSELDEATALGIYEDLNRRLAEQVHFAWTGWTDWTIGTAPNVAGVLGPTLPSGDEPGTGLATGHATAGLYLTD